MEDPIDPQLPIGVDDIVIHLSMYYGLDLKLNSGLNIVWSVSYTLRVPVRH